MHVSVDYPNTTRPVDARRFNAYGWVWLGDAQGELAAVEAWSADRLLGETGRLTPRGDVTAALGLAGNPPTAFDLMTDRPASGSGGEFDFHLRLRMRDGTRTEPLCRRRVKIASDAFSPAPEGRPPGTGAGGAKSDLLPPDHLQVRQVAGVWGPHFYTEGRVILDQVAAAFREAGRPLEDADAILDFGCGCGRLLWNFQNFPHRGEVWGSDVDGESIAWDQAHLGQIGRFRTNPSLPPAPFHDGQFDAIYSVSVFTHLPEELQFAWLTELRRILRPGGILVASVHGQYSWDGDNPDLKAEVEARGFAYRKGPHTEGLPDYYMAAFHSEAYIRTRWSWFFEFVGFKEKYIHGVQAAAILRRRDD